MQSDHFNVLINECFKNGEISFKITKKQPLMNDLQILLQLNQIRTESNQTQKFQINPAA